jgi:hypothetical protein
VDYTRSIHSVLPAEVLRQSIVLCAGLMGRLPNTEPTLRLLLELMQYAPVGLVTTSDRRSVAAPGTDPAGDWDSAQLESNLASRGLRVVFSGDSINNDMERAKTIATAVLENSDAPAIGTAPSGFQVAALICAFNEEDIVVPVLEQLLRDGIRVYFMDNWSTDRTLGLARRVLGANALGVECWPASGPDPTFRFEELLGRKEQLAMALQVDWLMHYDVDEIRESPWPGVSLRDAIYRVDRQGFNAIDFTLLEFPPVDNGYEPGSPLSYFQYAQFGQHPAHLQQVKAWRRGDGVVHLRPSAGHSADFEGRRVFPFKFLTRHYPVRSQSHGERKVLEERRPRYDPELRQRGWHVHYDAVDSATSFIRSPADLVKFDPEFHRRFLIERLSGIRTIDAP